MTHYLISGTLLGLFAGFSPGPLLALVISETLQYRVKAGLKVAISPVFTDIPIIFLTVFLLSELADSDRILGVISFIGGFLVLYFAYDCFRSKGITLESGKRMNHSLKKGIVVNALSPHPYLFWLSVGTPLLIKAADVSYVSAVCFLLSFYVMLVGSKILIALLTGKSRGFLTGRLYLYTLRFLGFCLVLFALFLFRDGIMLIK